MNIRLTAVQDNVNIWLTAVQIDLNIRLTAVQVDGDIRLDYLPPPCVDVFSSAPFSDVSNLPPSAAHRKVDAAFSPGAYLCVYVTGGSFSGSFVNRCSLIALITFVS